MVTEVPASFLVHVYKAKTGLRSNGQEALLELTKKCLEVTDETIRSKTAELGVTSMTDGQDPDENFLHTTLLHGQVERMGERISDRRFKGIMVQGLTTDCREVKMIAYRHRKMGLEEIQSTMRSMYLDDMSRRNNYRRGIAGRGAAMAVELARDINHGVCYNCRENGHFKSDCPTLANNKKRRHSSDGRQRKDKVEPGDRAGPK